MLTSVPKGSLAMAVAVWTRWDLSLVPAALAWSWGLMGNSVTAGGNHQSSGNVWRLTGITQESPAKEWHWVSCQSRSFWECFPLGWGDKLKTIIQIPSDSMFSTSVFPILTHPLLLPFVFKRQNNFIPYFFGLFLCLCILHDHGTSRVHISSDLIPCLSLSDFCISYLYLGRWILLCSKLNYVNCFL